MSGSRAAGIVSPASYSLSAQGGGEVILSRANIVTPLSPVVQDRDAQGGALKARATRGPNRALLQAM